MISRLPPITEPRIKPENQPNWQETEVAARKLERKSQIGVFADDIVSKNPAQVCFDPSFGWLCVQKLQVAFWAIRWPARVGVLGC